ncbi:sarcosine oxidase subunit gamma [Paracoccus sp. Z118]|uniref:sarcosine oxidase subunit gamma n=1 Tax=Paracoccus sp. Z118 TaxID=2851017 RepID=UPI0035302063
MPDRVHDLSPLPATGGAAPATARHGALTLTENDGLALASLALRRGGAQPAPFGLTLPGPGGWAAQGEISAFWTGPDQWMIEGHRLAGMDFAARVAAEASGASVTEQTDGFAAFEIRSSAGEAPILALLAKLVNIDPANLASGRAARTGLHHMSVFVIRRAPDHLAVAGMRSAAGTLWHVLETAVARLDAAAA